LLVRENPVATGVGIPEDVWRQGSRPTWNKAVVGTPVGERLLSKRLGHGDKWPQ
jgi:hypothetical protein